jgi:ribonuclease HIII
VSILEKYFQKIGNKFPKGATYLVKDSDRIYVKTRDLKKLEELGHL